MNAARTLIHVAFALGAALAPLAAQTAQGPKADAPRRVRDAARSEAVARRLKLTEAQRASITEIRARHRDAIQAHRQAYKEARLAFRAAARDPKTSLDQLRPLHEAVARRQFELMADRRVQRGEIRAQLTPEQREEAARLQGMAQARRQDRLKAAAGR